MASESQKVKGGQAPNMGVFFSPPEAPKFDSFSSSYSPFDQSEGSVDWQSKRRVPPLSNLLHTPPVSPHTLTKQEPGMIDGHATGLSTLKDPQLFPERHLDSRTNKAQPLFHTQKRSKVDAGQENVDEWDEHEVAAIAAHIQKRRKVVPLSQIPTQRQYRDFAGSAAQLSIRPRVIDTFLKDPNRYYQDRLAELRFYKSAWSKTHAHVPKAQQQAARQRVTKRAPVERMPRIRRQPRNSPRDVVAGQEELEDTAVQVEKPAKKGERKVEKKKAATLPHEPDVDFTRLVDYSPPISTLEEGGRTLKCDWSGSLLDLSGDPNRDLLHPDELRLATVLRLSCAQYLCCKRRIFATRLQCLRDGKNFNRTAAQNSCKVDVNKASRLWLAYDRVGWFNPRYMQQYL